MNSDERILQILANSACLSKGQLLGYMRHTLYPEELRAVELHLATCALCNDALEGLEAQADAEKLLSGMVPPVLPHVAPREKPKEKKDPAAVIRQEKPPVAAAPKTGSALPASESVQRLRKPGWGRPIGIAAALVLAFGALWYFVLDKREQPSEKLAQQYGETADKGPVSDTANPRLAAAMQVDEEKAKALAQEKKHKDSLYLARMEARKKAKKDSLDHALALNKADGQQAAPALASMRTAEDSRESTEVAADRVAAKKAMAAPPAARKDEDSKKDEPKESKKAPSDFEQGMQKYKEKNYASALLYFKSAESDKGDPHHWEAVYYSALCNKNLDKRRKAIKLFERVVDANAPQKKAAQKQLDELQKK